MWRRRWFTVDAAWRGAGQATTSDKEPNRVAIAEQAAEWFVTNDEGPLGERESAALVSWLKASPDNIEEFLGESGGRA